MITEKQFRSFLAQLPSHAAGGLLEEMRWVAGHPMLTVKIAFPEEERITKGSLGSAPSRNAVRMLLAYVKEPPKLFQEDLLKVERMFSDFGKKVKKVEEPVEEEVEDEENYEPGVAEAMTAQLLEQVLSGADDD